MDLIHSTKIKKLNPKSGFLAPYIRFPWNRYKNLIGKAANIYQVSDGQFIITIGNEFKPIDSSKLIEMDANESLKGNIRFKLENEGLKPTNSQTKEANDRARGLVGYDVAFTRRRSRVRISTGPLWFFSVFSPAPLKILYLCTTASHQYATGLCDRSRQGFRRTCTCPTLGSQAGSPVPAADDRTIVPLQERERPEPADHAGQYPPGFPVCNQDRSRGDQGELNIPVSRTRCRIVSASIFPDRADRVAFHWKQRGIYRPI